MEAELLNVRQVCAICGLSRATVYRLAGRGEFPRSVHVTSKAVRWRARDVRAWIESRPHAGEGTRE